MKIKDFMKAWILAFTVMFLLSGLFNGIIISSFIENNISSNLIRESPNMFLIGLGYAVLSSIMAFFYPRFIKPRNSTWMSGLTFGMIMGVVWLLPYSLVLHGVYTFPPMALLIDPFWALIEQGVGGISIALIYRERKYN